MFYESNFDLIASWGNFTLHEYKIKKPSKSLPPFLLIAESIVFPDIDFFYVEYNM